MVRETSVRIAALFLAGAVGLGCSSAPKEPSSEIVLAPTQAVASTGKKTSAPPPLRGAIQVKDSELWLTPKEPKARAVQLTRTAGRVTRAAASPDGRFVAYEETLPGDEKSGIFEGGHAIDDATACVIRLLDLDTSRVVKTFEGRLTRSAYIGFERWNEDGWMEFSTSTGGVLDSELAYVPASEKLMQRKYDGDENGYNWVAFDPSGFQAQARR